MKHKTYYLSLILGIALLGLAFIGNTVYAQETPGENLEIPYIDRNGDGVNDLLASGRAIGLLNRIQKSQQMKNLTDEEKAAMREEHLNMTEEERQAFMAERQAERQNLREEWLNMTLEERQVFLTEKFNEMIDTDNDGVADTKIGELFNNRQPGFIDEDGDGKPDKGKGSRMRGFRGRQNQSEQ
ncbi:hypothetical protein ACFL40_02055 [candidate division KSB1 bacterium]